MTGTRVFKRYQQVHFVGIGGVGHERPRRGDPDARLPGDGLGRPPERGGRAARAARREGPRGPRGGPHRGRPRGRLLLGGGPRQPRAPGGPPAGGPGDPAGGDARRAHAGQARDRHRRDAREDHDDLHGRRRPGRGGIRPDARRGRARHRPRLERAARPGRVPGGGGRRVRRLVPPAHADDRRRHDDRRRAPRLLSRPRGHPGGVPVVREQGAVLRRGGALRRPAGDPGDPPAHREARDHLRARRRPPTSWRPRSGSAS